MKQLLIDSIKVTVVKTTLLTVLALLSLFSQAADSKAELIKKGEYLARVGDCVSCHTVTDKKAFAGGHAMRTPFGTLYTPNITPDNQTGIGQWTFEHFWQALHHGKGYKGELLYPAFSYTSYIKVTREDALAIYTYLQSVPAIKQKNKDHSLSFPYNIRSALYAWRLLYFTPGEYQPDNNLSEEWNRGAYLVQGLGHCNECHTTRNALGAMDQKSPLAGGQIPVQGWYAPNLSMQKGGSLEGWSQEDMVTLLKTGLSARGGAIGPMADVVRNSTQYMTDADLNAVAVYLQTLPAPAIPNAVAQTEIKKAADYSYGQTIYTNHCASCHGKQGEGVEGIYPVLAGNPTVTEPTGINAIRSVLLGGFSVATKDNPEPYSMPPFAAQLNSKDVAAVVNYIRQSWGNNATAVQASEVAKARSLPQR